MSATTENIFLDKQHPAMWRSLNGLGLKAREAAAAAGVEGTIIELMYVRISQINGCAYCLDLHVGDAVANGESPQRLAVLPAWRDTALFTDRERAALALAESITELPDQRSREREEGYARRHLTADEFSAVSWLAITMNAFNRVSITSHHPVRRQE
ncbi:carboxymuconolactone decarboxylase family protein [Arthrobacter sp. BE255]|uniref:carboxymuconolactone decarboxylase family protein n=1 Tax=Arthrobacter sp. BE255 TaxID=2817721 RepID=UPI00285C8E12|nr:carboxymuconolactone decarboxylase family protein [Arthrobacter sp. BE255]MDR7158517.1 AhpD family alkylhydroperoxidase [Arthrobacter sp. BE255]